MRRDKALLIGHAVPTVLARIGARWAVSLVDRLEKEGIKVTIEGQVLKAGPAKLITEEIKRDLATAKPFLIDFHAWRKRREALTNW